MLQSIRAPERTCESRAPPSEECADFRKTGESRLVEREAARCHHAPLASTAQGRLALFHPMDAPDLCQRQKQEHKSKATQGTAASKTKGNASAPTIPLKFPRGRTFVSPRVYIRIIAMIIRDGGRKIFVSRTSLFGKRLFRYRNRRKNEAWRFKKVAASTRLTATDDL